MHKHLLTVSTFALLLMTARAEAQFAPAREVVPAEDFHVELDLRLWQPEPTMTLTTGDVRVGTVDFVREFGITNQRFNEFGVVLKPGQKHKVRFGYVPFKYNQDATLLRDVVVQNVTFPASAAANANISWDLYRFGYEWDFVSMSRGFVGLVTEVKYNRVKADVTGTASAFGQVQNFEASIDQPAPAPTIGGIARAYVTDYVSVTGEFTGLKVNRDNFRAKFYDFDMYATATFGKYVGARVGYRSIDVDFLADSDAGTMTMKGPYFGGVLKF